MSESVLIYTVGQCAVHCNLYVSNLQVQDNLQLLLVPAPAGHDTDETPSNEYYLLRLAKANCHTVELTHAHCSWTAVMKTVCVITIKSCLPLLLNRICKCM